MMRLSAVAFFLVCLPAGAVGVSDRPPGPDDIGYLPREGATVATNPPALAWLPEPGAEAYAVQFARDEAFSREVIEVPRTPYVLYTHTRTLESGAWWWRYAWLGKDGSRSNWSRARRFTIPGAAQPFPRPDEALIRERMPKQHPRLLLRPEAVGELRKARLGGQKQRWDQLVEAAENALRMPLIPEPPEWTGGKWNAEEWRRNFLEAIKASEAAETLAFCYMLTGETRYGEGARKWLLHIASWKPLGTTSMDVNDEAGMPILYLTSRAYDWAYDALGEADRETMRRMVRARGEEAYHWLHDRPHEQKAYNSHAGRMWHFLGEAAIAYYGEVPEAKKWLDYALTIFWGWYPAFGDEDGGWAQGYSYWASYVNRSTWWLDALNAALGVDGTQKPFYRNVGHFPMYVSPPRGALTGFGDFAEKRPNAEPAAVVAFFARARQVPEWQWYAEAWGKGEGATGPIGFIRAARTEPPLVKSKTPADWPFAKLFRGAGWAAMHSNLLDGADDVQVMMRAAPLGNISHSHADQNAIVLGAYGSPLLVNTGLRPWYGSPFCEQWYWTTRAHNALEIDGKGQPKTAAGRGEVIVFRPGKEYDYVVGDASTAYGENVERYRRHLVFLKPDVLVVVDEVKGKRPVSLKVWLHGRAPFTMDKSAGAIGLEYENAMLAGRVLAPGGLRFEQTDKYTIPPEMGKPEPEWHFSAETKELQTSARVVAVLAMAKVGHRPELDQAEDISRGGSIGVRFRHGGRIRTVHIDTAGPTLKVE
jgi:Domain of unknown function (DUF4962)/Heparinase II/III-like protein